MATESAARCSPDCFMINSCPEAAQWSEGEVSSRPAASSLISSSRAQEGGRGENYMDWWSFTNTSILNTLDCDTIWSTFLPCTEKPSDSRPSGKCFP